MTAAQAMADVVLRATQLSLAKQYARDNPADPDWGYVARTQRNYNEAVTAYTDPFGMKQKEES